MSVTPVFSWELTKNCNCSIKPNIDSLISSTMSVYTSFMLTFSFKKLFMYVFALLNICRLHTYKISQSSEEGIRFLRTEVTGGCKLPFRCWEPQLGLCKRNKKDSQLLNHLSSPPFTFIIKIFFKKLLSCLAWWLNNAF